MLRLRDVVGLRAEGVKGGEGRGGQTSGGGEVGWTIEDTARGLESSRRSVNV